MSETWQTTDTHTCRDVGPFKLKGSFAEDRNHLKLKIEIYASGDTLLVIKEARMEDRNWRLAQIVILNVASDYFENMSKRCTVLLMD